MLDCELTPAVYIAAGYVCQTCDSRLHFSQQSSAAPSFSSPECLKQQASDPVADSNASLSRAVLLDAASGGSAPPSRAALLPDAVAAGGQGNMQA